MLNRGSAAVISKTSKAGGCPLPPAFFPSGFSFVRFAAMIAEVGRKPGGDRGDIFRQVPVRERTLSNRGGTVVARSLPLREVSEALRVTPRHLGRLPR